MVFFVLPYGQEQIQYLFIQYILNYNQYHFNQLLYKLPNHFKKILKCPEKQIGVENQKQGNKLCKQHIILKEQQVNKIEWKLYVFVIISMSSNFLQRFKGKTTTLSKDGVQNILGTKNIASTQPQQNAVVRQQHSSANKPKSSLGQTVTENKVQQQKNKTVKQSSHATTAKPTKAQNPFLISNPFYLDEEQRERQEIQRKERLRIQQQTKKALQSQNNGKDPKQTTKTSNYSRSVEKKNNTSNKEWIRLGGLGANIGGDEWVQKKKKLQKMQQFAGQVKSINSQKIKPMPNIPKPKQKQQNPRQKALDYSKNVPKPVIKKDRQQQQQIEQPKQKYVPQQEQGLTQLQIYQMKHEQLKKMIHNQY